MPDGDGTSIYNLENRIEALEERARTDSEEIKRLSKENQELRKRIKNERALQDKSSLQNLDQITEYLDSLKKKSTDVYRDLYKERLAFMDDLKEGMDDATLEMHKSVMQSLLEESRYIEREYSESIEGLGDSLDSVDRKGHEVFVDHLSKNIKDIGTEFDTMVKNMGEKFSGFTKDADEQIVTVKNSLMEWANALNLNTLTKETVDSLQSGIEARREVQTEIKFTDDQNREMMERYSGVAKEYNGNYAKLYSQDLQLFADLGMTAEDVMNQNFATGLAAMSQANGVEGSDISNIVNDLYMKGQGGAFLETLASFQGYMKDVSGFAFNIGDLNESLNDFSNMLSMSAETPEEYMNAMLAVSGSLSTAGEFGIDSLVSDLITNIMSANSDQLGDVAQELAGMGITADAINGLKSAMGSGNPQEIAAQIQSMTTQLVTSFQSYTPEDFKTIFGSLGDWSEESLAQVANIGASGATSEDVAGKFNQMMGIIASGDYEGYAAERAQSMSKSLGDRITDSIQNEFAGSQIGQNILGVLEDINLDISDILLFVTAMSSIWGNLKDSKLVQTLTEKIFKRKSKKSGKGSAKGAAEAATGEAAGALGDGSGTRSGNSSQDAMDEATENAGTESSSGKRGKKGKTKGKKFSLKGAGKGLLKGAGKLGGILSIVDIAADAIEGFTSNSSDWFGEDAGLQENIASGLGTALGGSGGGLWSNEDVGTKMMNLGNGALKGAGIGTAIAPGIGTAIGAGVGLLGSAIGGENISTALNGAMTTIGQAGTWIGGEAQKLGGQLMTGASDVWNSFTQGGVIQAVGTLGTKVGEMANTLWTDFQATPVGTAISNFAGAIQQGATDIGTNIQNFFSSIGDTVGDIFGGIGDTFNSLFEGMANTPVGQFLGDAFNGVTDFFGGIGEGIGNIASNIFGTGEKSQEKSNNATITGANAIANTLSPGVNAVGQGLADFGGWLTKGLYDKGLSNVPYDMIAGVHKGEAILTPEQASMMRSMAVPADGGIDVESILAGSTGNADAISMMNNLAGSFATSSLGSDTFDPDDPVEVIRMVLTQTNNQNPIGSMANNIAAMTNMQKGFFNNKWDNFSGQALAYLKKSVASSMATTTMMGSTLTTTAATNSILQNNALNNKNPLNGTTKNGTLAGAIQNGVTNAANTLNGLTQDTKEVLSDLQKNGVEGIISEYEKSDTTASDVAAALENNNGEIAQYAEGTNFVPNDQLAYLHRGEAVVPAEFNTTAAPTGNNGDVASLTAIDIIDLLRIVQLGFDRVVDAINNQQVQQNSPTINNFNTQQQKTYSFTDQFYSY